MCQWLLNYLKICRHQCIFAVFLESVTCVSSFEYIMLHTQKANKIEYGQKDFWMFSPCYQAACWLVSIPWWTLQNLPPIQKPCSAKIATQRAGRKSEKIRPAQPRHKDTTGQRCRAPAQAAKMDVFLGDAGRVTCLLYEMVKKKHRSIQDPADRPKHL